MKVIDYQQSCAIEQDCLRCFSYNNAESAPVSCIKNTCGEVLELESKHDRIFFLMEGKVILEQENVSTTYESGTSFLILQKKNGKIQIVENAVMIIINVESRFFFCEYFPLQMLHQWKKNFYMNHQPVVHSLQIKTAISMYLENISILVSIGLRCQYCYAIKQQELFYYFRAYYSINELFSFFSPLLNSDSGFSELVYNNYESAKTIAELADITHYSVSGFKKRFIKVFGVSPHHWILKEKTKKIYNEITCTQKPFKEIAMRYHFYSVSHFSRFCKKMYSITPAKLRAQATAGYGTKRRKG